MNIDPKILTHSTSKLEEVVNMATDFNAIILEFISYVLIQSDIDVNRSDFTKQTSTFSSELATMIQIEDLENDNVAKFIIISSLQYNLTTKIFTKTSYLRSYSVTINGKTQYCKNINLQ